MVFHGNCFLILFFLVLEHYDTACVKEDKRQKSIVEFTKMKNFMQQFVSDPATNTTDTIGAINVDYDSDRDADMDGDASASMTDME
jgi:hypothetical protein